MDPNKDYYATLGVSPTAEDIVIRAAYKALAQRYHPDRSFEPDEANRRMVEINAAYEILSDSTARNEYDRLRGSKPKSGDSYFGEDMNDPPKGIDPLQKDWAVAVRYFPDLEKLESRLANLSWRVANAYRAYILETKAFETRAEVAETMEREFLNTYFGTNPAIVSYARSLIKLGHRAAAKELNEVVRVVGSNIDAAQVIDRIRTDFGVRTMVTSVEAEQLAARIASRATVGGRKNVRLIELEYYVKLINMIGGEVTWPSSGFFSEPRCRVLLSGVEHTFNNASDFSQWVLNEVIPNI
jgi:curved DNA-binding protein CbpA